MLIANIKWTPIRLGIGRIDSRRYIVSRDGQVRGKVMRDPKDNRWCSMRAYHPKPNNPHISFDSPTVRPSFKAAVLALCRHDMLYVSEDGSHEPRLMLVQRVGIGGQFFTFVTDPNGYYHPMVFMDFPEAMQEPTDRLQATLKKAIHQMTPMTGIKAILKACT